MKTYPITSTQTITQEQIDDILADAFYTAIAYWADTIDYGKEPTEPVTAMSEALTRGATIKIHDAEDDCWMELTIEKFTAALAKMHFNFDDYDNYDVDAAIQTALFGEPVYG